MVINIVIISIVYMKVYNDEIKSRETVDDLFSKIDMNLSGKVDFTGYSKIVIFFIEFIVAANN